MFVLWSSWNRMPIECNGPIKNTSHLTPIYLGGRNRWSCSYERWNVWAYQASGFAFTFYWEVSIYYFGIRHPIFWFMWSLQLLRIQSSINSYMDRLNPRVLFFPFHIACLVVQKMLYFAKHNILVSSILGEFTPSYILHTHAFKTYLWGGIYLAEKIIRWWYFTCKKPWKYYM